MKITNLSLGALLFAAVIPASASVNLITNPNFWDNSNAPISYFSTSTGSTIPGWTIQTGTNVDWIGSYWTAPTDLGAYPGGGSVDLDGFHSAGTISQTVSVVAGQNYTLNFFAGANPDGPPIVKSLLLGVTNATPGSATYSPTYPPSIESGNFAAWTLETFSFVPTASSVTISFSSLDTPDQVTSNSNGVSFGPVVAGVSLYGPTATNINAATPEPGFYGLLGGGLAGLAFFVRRRRTA